jgi:hypothetical protein
MAEMEETSGRHCYKEKVVKLDTVVSNYAVFAGEVLRRHCVTQVRFQAGRHN